MNDLPVNNYYEHTNTYLCADDITLISDNTINKSLDAMSTKITHWYKANKLSLNLI